MTPWHELTVGRRRIRWRKVESDTAHFAAGHEIEVWRGPLEDWEPVKSWQARVQARIERKRERKRKRRWSVSAPRVRRVVAGGMPKRHGGRRTDDPPQHLYSRGEEITTTRGDGA